MRPKISVAAHAMNMHKASGTTLAKGYGFRMRLPATRSRPKLGPPGNVPHHHFRSPPPIHNTHRFSEYGGFVLYASSAIFNLRVTLLDLR